MIERIEFKVGQQYENMKGSYKVVSIEDESMVIQWKNGDQMSTPIDLQRRIIERLDFEKRQAEGKPTGKQKKPKKSTAKKAKNFKGLESGDFKKTITKTTWRNRSCLGGAVTDRLRTNRFSFNSWAVSRTPMIQWDDEAHREKDDAQARFFAKVDEERLSYGLHIERPDKKAVKDTEWATFISWLEEGENEKWLNRVCEEHDLAIYDMEKKCFSETIRPAEGEWTGQTGKG